MQDARNWEVHPIIIMLDLFINSEYCMAFPDLILFEIMRPSNYVPPKPFAIQTAFVDTIVEQMYLLKRCHNII